MYGTGFGPTTPPSDGLVLAAPVPAATPPVVMVGGSPATVAFAGLISAGLYQLNIQLPAALPSGDAAISAQVGAFKTQTTLFIAVQ